jgi:hypothetical protein
MPGHPPFQAQQPAPGQTGAPWQQAPNPSFAAPDAPKRKDKKTILLFVILAIIFLTGLGWFVYNKWFSSITLETYSNEDFSISVPADYNREDKEFIEFKEKGPSSSQSEVVAYYALLPSAIGADQVDEFKELFRDELSKEAEKLADSDEKVEDLKITDTTYKGEDALQLTATVTRDGKKEGQVKLVAVINEKEVYLIGVAAHVSDPGVAKNIDTIINSFTLKD